MKAPGRPRRVSLAAIARDTGKLTKVLSKDARLPLINRAAMEVESVEAGAIRRIRWAAECYRCEGVCGTRWEILARDGLSGKMRASPSILAIVEEGVRTVSAISRERSTRALEF
ncbi:MAG: hypothetical protein L0220_20215 [Acidobacteria bacterium]|nr:hypothetical protein [Acidobacteriota bacterium]